MGFKTRLRKMKKGVVNVCKKFKKDKSSTEARKLMVEQQAEQEQPAAPKKKFMAGGFKKKEKKENSAVDQPDSVTEEESRATKSKLNDSKVTEATGSTGSTRSTVGTKSSVGTNKSTELTEEETEAMTDHKFAADNETSKENVLKAVMEVVDLYKEINYQYKDNILLLEKLLNHSMASTKGKEKEDDVIEGIKPLLVSLFAVARECSTLFFQLGAGSEEMKKTAIKNFKLFFHNSITGMQTITSDPSPTYDQESLYMVNLIDKPPPPTIRVTSDGPTANHESIHPAFNPEPVHTAFNHETEITRDYGLHHINKKGSSSKNPFRQ